MLLPCRVAIATLVLSVPVCFALCACGQSSPTQFTDTPGAGLTPGTVQVYLTTANLDKTLARQADLFFEAGDGSATTNVVIDASQKFQTLTAGFGVALTDSSAFLLQTVLPPKLRDQAMKDLFSPTEGIGLSYVRLGMGGTDFNVSKTGYTYDDLPAGQTDPTLEAFSLDHDREYIIPAAQQALRLNPDIVFTTSPWSPPAWMKTDGELTPTTPLSLLKPAAFAPWAQYFVKFLQGYAAAGINFSQVSIQNEPLNSVLLPGIPGLLLPPNDAANLINNYLYPALAANGLKPKLMIWDFIWDLDTSYIPLTMALASSHVDALAFHCYLADPTIMTAYHAIYGLPQYETECSSKLSSIEPQQMAIRALNNYAEGVQLWNAALDTNFGPKFGNGCQGQPGTTFAGQACIAPITVDTTTKTYTYTSDYWALGHFSKFIRNGAKRISSTGLATCLGAPISIPCSLEGTAFENPDGSHALVLSTSNGMAQTFTLTENGQHVTYTLPAKATATLFWKPAT